MNAPVAFPGRPGPGAGSGLVPGALRPWPSLAGALRLGTRASPLALAQSRRVAAALAAAHPGLEIELVPALTRGDRDLRADLRDVRDPAFFSAELDEALREGEVDFCVHSLKDLPDQPGEGLVRAALLERADPRDVVLFRPGVDTRLRAGRVLRIGSSSDRRRLNVASFLPGALPRLGPEPALRFESLRGSIDQRLARLGLPAEHPDALDGVVLALAGLARLWDDAPGRRVLEPLLAGLRWMVLPLSRVPAAPGQGVLAVECRVDDGRTRALLEGIHAPTVAALLQLERAALDRLPPAARDGLGATAIEHPVLGPLCFLRGHAGIGSDPVIETVRWNAPPPVSTQAPVRAFDSAAWQALCRREPLPVAVPVRGAVFLAASHGATGVDLPGEARLWVSGVGSWRELAARGLWVEGCTDNLGFATLGATLATGVLGLPGLAEWTVLTHVDAVPGWADSGVGTVRASYALRPPEDAGAGADAGALAQVQAEAARATHFYWRSPEAFRALRDVIPADAHHACGAGKTLEALRAAGVDGVPFPGHREWRAWLP